MDGTALKHKKYVFGLILMIILLSSCVTAPDVELVLYSTAPAVRTAAAAAPQPVIVKTQQPSAKPESNAPVATPGVALASAKEENKNSTSVPRSLSSDR